MELFGMAQVWLIQIVGKTVVFRTHSTIGRMSKKGGFLPVRSRTANA